MSLASSASAGSIVLATSSGLGITQIGLIGLGAVVAAFLVWYFFLRSTGAD